MSQPIEWVPVFETKNKEGIVKLQYPVPKVPAMEGVDNDTNEKSDVSLFPVVKLENRRASSIVTQPQVTPTRCDGKIRSNMPLNPADVDSSREDEIKIRHARTVYRVKLNKGYVQHKNIAKALSEDKCKDYVFVNDQHMVFNKSLEKGVEQKYFTGLQVPNGHLRVYNHRERDSYDGDFPRIVELFFDELQKNLQKYFAIPSLTSIELKMSESGDCEMLILLGVDIYSQTEKEKQLRSLLEDIQYHPKDNAIYSKSGYEECSCLEIRRFEPKQPKQFKQIERRQSMSPTHFITSDGDNDHRLRSKSVSPHFFPNKPPLARLGFAKPVVRDDTETGKNVPNAELKETVDGTKESTNGCLIL